MAVPSAHVMMKQGFRQMSDEGYIVVTAESVCAIMCHDKVVGIQAMSDKGHAVLMESVPPAGVSMEECSRRCLRRGTE